MYDASEYECQELWLWMKSWGKKWVWMPKKRKCGDSKCQNEYAQWLSTSKLKKDVDTEYHAEQWL